MKIDLINRKLDRFIVAGIAVVWALLAVELSLALMAMDVLPIIGK